jgi:hypothetical protein
VHGDLDTGVAVDAPERDTMDRLRRSAAERGAARSAEAEAPSRCGLEAREIALARDPLERAGSHLGVGGAGPAECLATPRTMAAAPRAERCRDPVAYASAETAAGDHVGIVVRQRPLKDPTPRRRRRQTRFDEPDLPMYGLILITSLALRVELRRSCTCNAPNRASGRLLSTRLNDRIDPVRKIGDARVELEHAVASPQPAGRTGALR